MSSAATALEPKYELHRALAAEVAGRRDQALELYETSLRSALKRGNIDRACRAGWMGALLCEELGRPDEAFAQLQKLVLHPDCRPDQYATTTTLALRIAKSSKEHASKALALDAQVSEAFQTGRDIPVALRCANLCALAEIAPQESRRLTQRRRALIDSVDSLSPSDCENVLDVLEAKLPEDAQAELAKVLVASISALDVVSLSSRVLSWSKRSKRTEEVLRVEAREELDKRIETSVEEELPADPAEALRQVVDLLDRTEHEDDSVASASEKICALCEEAAKKLGKLTSQGEELLFSVAPRLAHRNFREQSLLLLDGLTKTTARLSGPQSRAALATELRKLQALHQIGASRAELLPAYLELEERAVENFGRSDPLLMRIQRQVEVYRWQTRPLWRRIAGRIRRSLRRATRPEVD